MTITTIVYSFTKSATFSAAVMLFYVIGKLISTFVFPIFTERFNLNKILNRAQFFQLLVIICLITATVIDYSQDYKLPFIFALIGLSGFLDGFVSPSRMSLLPKLVESTKIGKANSLISTTDQTFALLGWSLGSLSIAIYGGEIVLLVSLTLLILAYISSFPIEPIRNEKVVVRTKMESIKVGWSVLFEKKNDMRTITTMDILEGIASGIWIGGITLVFVSEVLVKGEHWWGFINTGYYVGSILGGLIITVYSVKLQKNLIKGIIISSFSVSILVLLYSINHNAWIALILVIFMGPFYQWRDISQQTYIQKNITEDKLPKLYAAKDNFYYITFALSVFITGIISDIFGVTYVYYFAFILYLSSTIYAFLKFWRKSNSLENDISV